MSIVQQAEPIAALCVIVLLVLISGRLARRFLPASFGIAARSTGGIAIGAPVALDAHRRVVMVSVEQDRFLVLLGRNGDVSLGRLGMAPSDRSTGLAS